MYLEVCFQNSILSGKDSNKLKEMAYTQSSQCAMLWTCWKCYNLNFQLAGASGIHVMATFNIL